MRRDSIRPYVTKTSLDMKFRSLVFPGEYFLVKVGGGLACMREACDIMVGKVRPAFCSVMKTQKSSYSYCKTTL